MTATSSSLASLLETLNLLIEQARAYEHALPANDYRARAAVAALSRLAERARSEATSLAEQNAPQAGQLPHPFSPREFQVLLLTMDGLTNKEIGFHLGISERTVQFHLNSIFNKTDTNSRTEAVAQALRKGWLTRGS